MSLKALYLIFNATGFIGLEQETLVDYALDGLVTLDVLSYFG